MNIDLSCDLGEASDADAVDVETRIWPRITSANIACGGHAGDEATMRSAVQLALAHGVAIGAHPSYPDRENFGRRSMKIGREQLRAALLRQLDDLARVSAREGGVVRHVKPHGALYNDAHHDAAVARVIVDACRVSSLALVVSHGSALEREAKAAGCRVILEGFGDRRYRSDGSLQPRGEAGALLLDPDEAAAQAVSLARSSRAATADGTTVMVPCETICIHSDMDGAVDRLERIRAALQAAGFSFAAVATEG